MIKTAGKDQRWNAKSTEIFEDCSRQDTINTDTSIIWVYSYNEWAEGSGMEELELRSARYPYGFGTEPLQRLRDGVSAASVDPPTPPEPLEPAGIVEGLRPTFIWNGAQDAVEYELKVHNSIGALVLHVTQPGTAYTPAPAEALAANDWHTWKVRARTSASDWGDYSSPVSFKPTVVCTGPPTGRPTPLSPLAGCSTTTTPTFHWTSVEGASAYRLVVHRRHPTDPSQDIPVLGITVPETQFTFNLSPGERYRWKVRAENACGLSTASYSNEIYFETPPCGAPLPTISVNDVSLTEGNVGTSNATFTVALSPASTQTVTVNYGTEECTAWQISSWPPWPSLPPRDWANRIGDYSLTSGTLTFQPGETTKTIVVPISNDEIAESDELFKLNLSNPVNASITDGWGQATVFDEPLAVNPPKADFNSDGHTDVLWRNSTTDVNAVWLMNAASVIGTPVLDSGTGSGWDIVGTADFSGDGKTDILWHAGDTGENVIWFMDGTTKTGWVRLPTVQPTEWKIAGTGDFDGDGRPDIVWHQDATGAGTIWLMPDCVPSETEVCTYTGFAPLETIVPLAWKIVGVGDFSGDGKTDLLWRQEATGDDVIWLMPTCVSGTTCVKTGYASLETIEPNWRIEAAGDFDRNGSIDILWRYAPDGHLAIWLMDSTTRVCTIWANPDRVGPDWHVVGPR